MDPSDISPEIHTAPVGRVRSSIRSGGYEGPTSGMARAYAQANLVALPQEYAFDFLKFCVRNPRSCPVMEVTEAGSAEPVVTAPGADLRTDLPRYRVYESGRLIEEPQDISGYWREDMVAFLLGCSFTFEAALIEAGLRIAHQDQNRNVPMYATDRECVASGPFAGPLVVSMRPYRAEEIPRVVSVTGRFPGMHGAPVHIGDPESLGIRDLADPEFGEAVELREDQLPVFWACGVTPQLALSGASLPLVITHSPGHMFITDRLNTEYSI